MINNETIKKEIKGTLDQVEQWQGYPSNFHEYSIRLQCLIELLEDDN